MQTKSLEKLIKNYKNFPEKGIIFRDISPILADAKSFSKSIDLMAELVDKLKFTKLVAIDARGFIFASALAYKLGKGLVMCRKPSKLPGKLFTQKYKYEYAHSSLSVSKETLTKKDKVLIVDDVLATGSTALAAYNLISKTGAQVSGMVFFLELGYLNGRSLLTKNVTSGIPIASLIKLDK